MTSEMPFRPLDGWSRRTASPEFFEFLSRQVFIVCRTFTYSFPPEPVPKFSVQGWFGSVGHSVLAPQKDGSFSKKPTNFCCD